jgi:hypothetical protein
VAFCHEAQRNDRRPYSFTPCNAPQAKFLAVDVGKILDGPSETKGRQHDSKIIVAVGGDRSATLDRDFEEPLRRVEHISRDFLDVRSQVALEGSYFAVCLHGDRQGDEGSSHGVERGNV